MLGDAPNDLHSQQPDPTVSLTPDQIAAFHRDGFLVLDKITEPQEIERLREIYDGLFSRRAGREEGMQFDLGGTDEEGKEAVLPQILAPRKYAPEIGQGLFLANAERIAGQLLGDAATFNGDHAIFKPARTGAATPWHQDEAYWNPSLAYRSFSLWMPLQEASIENGCLWFVQGSHEQEVWPHRSIGGDVRVHGLELDEAKLTADQKAGLAKAVPAPIPAGGCTIHLNRTLHYAGPNTSDIPRRAYIIGYGLPTTRRDEPAHYPWQAQKRTARMKRAEQAKSIA
jgi:ectoine hydroxylase-related dioxygenase (phytanoyl-CoA dioxygenase family)